MEERSIAAGTMIMSLGKIGHEMFLIVDGRAHVFLSQQELQRNAPLKVLEPGSFFGEAALLTSEPRNAFVRSHTQMEVYVLSTESLGSVLSKFPAAEQAFKQRVENVIQKRQKEREASSTSSSRPSMVGTPQPNPPTTAVAHVVDQVTEMKRMVQQNIQNFLEQVCESSGVLCALQFACIG
eukprot:SAG31_NODE_15863_length_734_cov_1.302362_2_plen_181_part_00